MNFDEGQIAGFAIQKIKPNSEFGIGNTYESLTWNDESQTKPTKQEFNDAVTAWHKEYDAQEYARNRASEYPALADQLDMQYHDQLNGTTTWQDAIAKVKADNPKEAE